MLITEDLKEYDYSIHTALSELADIEEYDAKKITQEMEIGEYISLVQALDNEDTEEIKTLIEPYKDMINNNKEEDNNKKDDDKKEDKKDVEDTMDLEDDNEEGEEMKSESKNNKFKIGEKVLYKNREAYVSSLKETKGKIGLKIGKDHYRVNTNNIKKLDEGVIGSSTVPGLGVTRMSKLAGIKEDFDDFDYTQTDDAEPITDEPVSEPVSQPITEPVAEPSTDVDFEPAFDVEAEPEPETGMQEPMQTDVVEDTSEAFQSIESSLENIKTLMPDIRLDEYRSLLRKLDDVKNQVRSMGKDYLGERHKKD